VAKHRAEPRTKEDFMSTTYSNPRLVAQFDDWPYGKLRARTTFKIEFSTRGERASRVTVNPKNGRLNKPKVTTYAQKVRIVDGDDGKTYIIEKPIWGHISVMKWDLQFQHETIGDNDPRYAETLALFN